MATIVVPDGLKSPAVTLSASNVSKEVSVRPTIFVGIVDNNFNHHAWEKYKQRYKQLFSIKEGDIFELKLEVNNNKLEVGKLQHQTAVVIGGVNAGAFSVIRVVRLGVSCAAPMFAAVRALVREWNYQDQEDTKSVQLVCMGDSVNRDWLEFARVLCLDGTCGEVQYYRTTDYDIFGHLNFSIGEVAKRLNDSREHRAPQKLEPSWRKVAFITLCSISIFGILGGFLYFVPTSLKLPNKGLQFLPASRR